MATDDPWGVAAAPTTSTAGADPWGVAASPAVAVKHADTNIGKMVGKVIKPVGNAIVYGTKHPFDAAMNVLGAPQRGLQSLETNDSTNEGQRLGTAWGAMTHPQQGPALTNKVKAQTGLSKLEAGPLAGSDLPHKLARGVADTGLDVVNDPLSFLPVGKIAKVAGKVIPGLAHGAEAVGDALKGTKVGKALDPEASLEGLTPKGKATFEAIQNRAVSNVKGMADKEEAVIRQYADEIRKGNMPPQVAALFRKASNVPAIKPGTRPQDVVSALARDRSSVKFAQQNSELRNAGLIRGTPLSKKAMAAITDPNELAQRMAQRNIKPNAGSGLFAPGADVDAVRKALGVVANPHGSSKNDPLLNLARQATRLGNKAFLANPIPHTGNLANLAYNKYGLPTTLAGLGNAARIATGTVGKGKLASDIGELGNLGAKSEYRNIFDELGLTKILGIPGTQPLASLANKAIIPAEKLSNLAQHKILNSTETGLRAAALNAEKKGGAQGVEAARNIHNTFGTGPQSALIKSISEKGTPFAGFHLATAPASGIKTLATNPGRVANVLKANRDFNNDVNPGSSAKYRSSVPSMSTARALAAPLSYFSNLGPLSELNSPYGAVQQLQKGPKGVANFLGETAGRFVPGSQELGALKDLIEKKKGPAGEAAISDLIASLVGGYMQKGP
jgi:hypothetical protein